MRALTLAALIAATTLTTTASTSAPLPLALWYRIEYTVTATIVQKSEAQVFERTTSCSINTPSAVLLGRIERRDFKFHAGTFGDITAHYGLERRLTEGPFRDCLTVYREKKRHGGFEGTVSSASVRLGGITHSIGSYGGQVNRSGTITCGESCTLGGCTGRVTVRNAGTRTVTAQIGWPLSTQLRFRQGGFGQPTITFERSGIKGFDGRIWDFKFTFRRCRDQDLEQQCRV